MDNIISTIVKICLKYGFTTGFSLFVLCSFIDSLLWHEKMNKKETKMWLMVSQIGAFSICLVCFSIFIPIMAFIVTFIWLTSPYIFSILIVAIVLIIASGYQRKHEQ